MFSFNILILYIYNLIIFLLLYYYYNSILLRYIKYKYIVENRINFERSTNRQERKVDMQKQKN